MMAVRMGDHRHGLEVMEGETGQVCNSMGGWGRLFALHYVRARRHQGNLCDGKQTTETSKMTVVGEGEEGPVTHLRISDAITMLQV